MNLTNLQYFVTVAEELNISRAAQKLFTSPQALSDQIRRLESSYDVKFFQRTPRLQLTYAGERFLQFAKHVLADERELSAELNDIGMHKRGKLSVGFTVFLQRAILPEILPRFHRENPYIELDIQTGYSKPLMAKLLDGQLDLIICNYSGDLPSGVEVAQTLNNHFCLVIPREILARRGMSQDPEVLIRTDLRPLLEQEPLLMNIPGSQSRNLTEHYLGQLGLHLSPLIQLSEMNCLLHLCAKGMGIAFSFEVTGRMCLSFKNFYTQVVMVPLREYDERSQVYVAYNAERHLPWAARKFLELLPLCHLESAL